jgi:arylsulfatase A-like enzyme
MDSISPINVAPRRWVALIAGAMGLAAWAGAAEEPPNILFVLADDVSYRNVGCYEGSHPWARTPHIDALASAGVRFTRGYAGAWCMPSRATLMTGRQQYGNATLKLNLLDYPSSTYDPEKMPLWPAALRERGYFTGMIGKWHIGKDAGWGRAWDHQRVWNRCAHTDNAHAYYEAQMIETDGGPAERVEGYPTDFYTDWAVDFIEGKTRAAGRPWFLWLCYGTAHGPFTPAARHRELFPGIEAPVPADVFPPRPGKPSYMQKVATWLPGSDGRPKLEHFHTPKGSTVGLYGPDLSDWERQYQQTITGLDENVARLVKALEATGQQRKTLVVFTADQGFAWGQHGFASKMAPYDANIRPPLIFSQPGTLPEGEVCRHPVTGPDIVSTLLAQSGTPEPWTMHGHDFSPLLAEPGRREWEHGALLAMTGIQWGEHTDHLPALIKHTQHVPWWVSYSKGPLKYIRTLEHNELEELYDLEKDPQELDNLALKPEHHARIAEFRALTEAELVRTGAGFAGRLPKVFPLDGETRHRLRFIGTPGERREGPLSILRPGGHRSDETPPFHLD